MNEEADEGRRLTPEESKRLAEIEDILRLKRKTGYDSKPAVQREFKMLLAKKHGVPA